MRLRGPARHLIASFRSLTPAQRETIPLVLKRTPVFLIAPTATGKTEAAVCPVLELRRRERWEGKPSILYVVPTRALVNDLHRRLSSPLSGYIDVGRRTGEYREPDSDLLITTPESFDSMLARGRGGDGTHLLQGVRAVILDELHLLIESARGTQLLALLSRLNGIASEPVLRLALSATVGNANVLAERFLGPGAAVVSLGGGRSLRVDRTSGAGPLPERVPGVVDPLAREIWRKDGNGICGISIPDRLLGIRAEKYLKALVFVPSRKRCDQLSAEISRHFIGRCPVPVVAHHGSLSQSEREKTEETLATAPESVAVATTTLELGIDIGDVNLVVLDGPPGSVSSLLQRIGRANRREKAVHLIPIARSAAEACTFASMIRSAERGELDDEGDTAHYSVVIQQLASLFFQSATGRIRGDRIERIFMPVFGNDTPYILEKLSENLWIHQLQGGLFGPGETIREIMDNPMALHSNISGGGSTVPLIDAVTGDTLAWVGKPRTKQRVQLAGSSFQIVRTPEAYELRSRVPGGAGKTLDYGWSSPFVGRSALRHLCLGLGLPETAICRFGDRWIHFGGKLYSRILSFSGVDSDPMSSGSDPRAIASADFEKVVDRHWEKLERFCSFGPSHKDLPRPVRKAAVIASIPIGAFKGWLEAKEECRISEEQASILFSAR